jgi:murein DD-endopeptidase MepM/ murein hydrolase activator NlpD
MVSSVPIWLARRPFTGEMSRHDGTIAAPLGTPIHAAAGGLSGCRAPPIYGNVVEIDHGKAVDADAHASRLTVRASALVRRARRSAKLEPPAVRPVRTCAEVHSKGVAQNPAKFLFADGNPLQQHAASSARIDLKALANAAAARN